MIMLGFQLMFGFLFLVVLVLAFVLCVLDGLVLVADEAEEHVALVHELDPLDVAAVVAVAVVAALVLLQLLDDLHAPEDDFVRTARLDSGRGGDEFVAGGHLHEFLLEQLLLHLVHQPEVAQRHHALGLLLLLELGVAQFLRGREEHAALLDLEHHRVDEGGQRGELPDHLRELVHHLLHVAGHVVAGLVGEDAFERLHEVVLLRVEEGDVDHPAFALGLLELVALLSVERHRAQLHEVVPVLA